MNKKNVLVVGSGSWGTALAQVLADNGHNVLIYGNEVKQIDDINKNHKNSFYFDDLEINKDIKATNDLKNAFVNNYDIILLVVPTTAMKFVLNDLKPYVKNEIIVNAAKGFDSDGKTMHESIKECFPNNQVLSILGPSHAEEVIRRDLTFVNIADDTDTYGYMVAYMFDNFYFKTKVISDVKTAEFGCTFKNAIALMSGIYTGLGFHDNARAALYTDGLNEMLKLGKALNLNQSILLDYTGAGDLAVTCYSTNSRNFQSGVQIGQLNSYSEFAKNNIKTVEGIRTVNYIYNISEKLNIKLPIIHCLYNIIYKNIEPSYAVDNLINKKAGLYD